MADLGRAALVVSLGLALYALVAGGWAPYRRRRPLAAPAQKAAPAPFGSTALASAILVAALVRRDFSFTYVADHTSRGLPLPYTLSAFWGGPAGARARAPGRA